MSVATFASILVIAAALAMDAFAVAIGKGLALGSRADARRGITVGAWFGVFQGLMPVIGFFVASTLAGYIEDYDHWIAFALLVFIGVGMLRSGLAGADDDDHDADMRWRTLLLLAVATSIDALAAGASFALADIPIVAAAVTIGVVTFLLSGIGVRLGSALGARWQKAASIAGGVVLILMGIKIVLEHTGVLG